MGPEQKPTYLLLDGHGWTVLPKLGVELHRPASHITEAEYNLRKGWNEEPEKLAERAFDAFTAIRADGQIVNREMANLIAEGGWFLVDKIKSLLPNGDFPPGAFSDYDVAPGIPKGLRYARDKKMRVILNSGAPDINSMDLRRKLIGDKVLHLFNSGIAFAMRPLEVPVSLRDKLPNQSALTTPFSKGGTCDWIAYGVGGEVVLLEDMPEPTDVARAYGHDAAMNCRKEEAENRREHETPIYLRGHLTKDGPHLTSRGRGKLVYRATIERVVDWRLGLNNVQIVPIDEESGEYEFFEPRILVQRPEIPLTQAVSDLVLPSTH